MDTLLEFNNRMTEAVKGNDFDEIIDKMFIHMKMQVENLTLVDSRFVFDWVLFLDINFHKLKLIRGSSYLPIPDLNLS